MMFFLVVLEMEPEAPTSLHWVEDVAEAELLLRSTPLPRRVSVIFQENEWWRRTCLHTAAMSNKLKLVKFFFDELNVCCTAQLLDHVELMDEFIMKQDNEGYTALHKSGSSEISELLIQSVSTSERRDRFISTKSMYGANALHFAQTKEMAELLIMSISDEEMRQQMLTTHGVRGRTTVSLAAWRGAADVIQVIFDNCSALSRQFLISRTDIFNDTPLHRAALSGSQYAVDAIIEELTDTELIEMSLKVNESRTSSMHYLIIYQMPEALSQILKRLNIEQRKKALLRKNRYGYSARRLALMQMSELADQEYKYLATYWSLSQIIKDVPETMNRKILKLVHLFCNEYDTTVPGTMLMYDDSGAMRHRSITIGDGSKSSDWMQSTGVSHSVIQ